MRIRINGVLGDWPYGDVSPQEVMDVLDQVPADEPLRIEWHSPGGYTDAGKSIYHAISQHEAEVTSDVVLAGSAASWGAMAADKVRVFPHSEFFVHNSQIGIYAQVNRQGIDELLADIGKTRDHLERLDESMAKIYADRSGVGLDTIQGWMEAETTFFGREIVEAGFATELVETEQRPANFRGWDLSKLGTNYVRSKYHVADLQPTNAGITICDTQSSDEDEERLRELEINEAFLAVQE